MRRRIVLAMVVIALVGVVVLGVPLAIVASRIAHTEAQRRVDQEAAALAFAIDDVLEANRPVTEEKLDALAHDGFVVLTEADGTRTTGGDPVSGASISATAATAQNAKVRLTVPSDDVNDRALGSILLVAGLGALGVLSAVILAYIISGRLAAPLRNLATTSRRLGDGDLSARAEHFGIAEPDAVADALNDSAARIEALVEAEREFSANVSHQLRTPLTALSMHLEELGTTVEGQPAQEEVDAALEQADRLGATITDLLALARRGRLGPSVDSDAVALDPRPGRGVADALPRRGTVRPPRRRARVHGPRAPRARSPRPSTPCSTTPCTTAPGPRPWPSTAGGTGTSGSR